MKQKIFEISKTICTDEQSDSSSQIYDRDTHLTKIIIYENLK